MIKEFSPWNVITNCRIHPRSPVDAIIYAYMLEIMSYESEQLSGERKSTMRFMVGVDKKGDKSMMKLEYKVQDYNLIHGKQVPDKLQDCLLGM